MGKNEIYVEKTKLDCNTAVSTETTLVNANYIVDRKKFYTSLVIAF